MLETVDALAETSAPECAAAPGDLVVVPFVELLPAAVVEKLKVFALAAFKGGYSRKSVSALISDGRLFAGWCASRNQAWLPATSETIVEFIEAMAAAGKSPATIARYLWAIGKWHGGAGVVDPTDHVLVRMARRADLRQRRKRQKQAKPIGEREVGELIASLEVDISVATDAMEQLTALRDRALFLVAHDTLARADELINLRWEDLSVDEEGDGLLLIRQAKNDQEGEGFKKWIDRDTVRALMEWRVAHDEELRHRVAAEDKRMEALRQKRFGARWPQGRKRLNPQTEPVPLSWEPSPFLFRGLSPHYEYEATGPREVRPQRVLVKASGWSVKMSTSTVSRIFQQRLTEIGIDPAGYSAHSTRVGKCQDILADGADLFQAMQAGPWATSRMPARYGENILAARGVVATQKKRKRRQDQSEAEEKES